MPEEFVSVPVPSRWVLEIYKRLSELDAAESRTSEPAEAAMELDAELIARMFNESQPAHRELMAFLARHPDEWFYTSDLARQLELDKGSRALAGMLGAFGRRSKHRYGGLTPWQSEWDGAREEARHRMPQDVAAQVLALADHASVN